MVDLSGPAGFLKDKLKKFDRHPLRRKKIRPYVIAKVTTLESKDACEKICRNCQFFSRIEGNAEKRSGTSIALQKL